MSLLSPPLYFTYIAKLYTKNLLAILFGLSTAFATIDYFQHLPKLDVSGNYKILYIFYMWQEALGLLYPLAIVFAVIMTKFALIKNSTMGAFHAFGYSKRRLLLPLISVAMMTYILFTLLHTTKFSYAKDMAMQILENELHTYDVNDLFFKYNDTFVYIKKLDPIAKKIEDITIFKVDKYQVRYTIHAPMAHFDGELWTATDATLKTHIYENGELIRYRVEHKEHIKTLYGYKPKIIESLYEGKTLNIIDAVNTWKLLAIQGLSSNKIRAALYEKAIVPLFSIALVLLLFFKLPFHARMVNLSGVMALAMGVTFIVWGLLFGLNQIGKNGVLAPEYTVILPILLLWGYALYTYRVNEKHIV